MSVLASAPDFALELGAIVGVGLDPAACESGPHGGKIGRGRARVIDRHQRLIVGLVDQDAGVLNAQGRVVAERRRDHAHDQKRDQDAAANGRAERGHGRGAAAPAGQQPVNQFDTRATHAKRLVLHACMAIPPRLKAVERLVQSSLVR